MKQNNSSMLSLLLDIVSIKKNELELISKEIQEED